jgi:hypothetical protein
MVFHQPLIPVLPVARELISKTKWIGSKGSSHSEMHGHLGSAVEDDATSRELLSKRHGPSPHRPWRKTPHRTTVSSGSLISSPLTSEPESTADAESKTAKTRSRVLGLFTHNSSLSSNGSNVCLFLARQVALADCWSLALDGVVGLLFIVVIV